MLGANSDINEANSLSYEKDIIDIYSNSWGPPDTGYHVDGPGYLTKRVFERGVREVKFCLYCHMQFHASYNTCRDVMEKAPYMFGLMVTEVAMMIVRLMVTVEVYTPYLLEPLV